MNVDPSRTLEVWERALTLGEQVLAVVVAWFILDAMAFVWEVWREKRRR